MEKQDEFFEKGLAEILSSNCASPVEQAPLANHIHSKESIIKPKRSFPISDIIVRLVSTIIAVLLLIGYSVNISIR